MTGRWGIFGGLFDPVHNGHLHLARNLRSLANLDGILLVPSANPQHKDQSQPAPFNHRTAMLNAAIAIEPDWRVSEIELEQQLSGYALDSVRAIKKRYPNARFSFIIGADNIGDLINWYHYEELLDEVELIAGSRGGIAPEQFGPLANRVKMFEIEPLDISSSLIRQLLKEDRDSDTLKKLMPSTVLEYIDKQNLYR